MATRLLRSVAIVDAEPPRRRAFARPSALGGDGGAGPQRRQAAVKLRLLRSVHLIILVRIDDNISDRSSSHTRILARTSWSPNHE
jgi:hypothetical protein